MKGKVAGEERSSFTRRVRYWGKNIPLHRKNFFPHSLKLVKSKNHCTYFALRKGQIERGARTSCAHLEDTQKVFGTAIFIQASSAEWMDNCFRETCRHLALERQQCVDMAGPKDALLTWLLSLGHNTCLPCSVRFSHASEVLPLYAPPCTGLLQEEPMDQHWKAFEARKNC